MNHTRTRLMCIGKLHALHFYLVLFYFSFGVVLWEMIAKEQPFRGMSPIQAAFAVARQQMRPALPAYTPVKLGELVEHCWHQSSEMRPTFEELIEVLPLVKAAIRRREFSKLGFVP